MMKDTKQYEIFLYDEFKDILTHKEFKKLETFNHHGGVSCMEHTLDVAELTHKMTRNRNMDAISATRGALLHDFYLYDWHTDSPGFHGLKHPFIAARNAEQFFQLNRVEKDAILRHMWPMIPIPPRFIESFVVSLADKIVTVGDYASSIGESNWMPYHTQCFYQRN